MNRVDWQRIPWGPRDVCLYFVLLVLSLWALVLIGGLVSQVPHILGFPPSPLVVLVVAAVIQGVVMVGLVLVVGLYRYDSSWADLGFLGGVSVPWMRGVGGGLVMLLLSWVYGYVASRFAVNIPSQPLVEQFTQNLSLAGIIVFFLITVILAPVTEELVFRGFIFAGLRRRWRFVPAALVSALAFTVIHLSFHWVPFLQVLLLGLGLTWIYESSRNLIAPILAHAVYNLAITVLIIVTF